MNKGLSRRVFLGAMLAGGAYALLPRIAGAVVPGQARVPGWLLRDVLLVDGTGAPGRRTDVLVRGDSVEHIGRVPDARARGLRVVEGGGRVLAPGFIDLHTHGNPLRSAFTPFLAMGVTTVVLGQDGGSPSLEGAGREPGSLQIGRAHV